MTHALRPVAQLRDGYGDAVAFVPESARWAAAATGELHLWDGLSLAASIDIPGYQRGNLAFDADGASVRAGRWVVGTSSGAASYCTGNPDLLVTHIDGPLASYPERFSETAVYWGPRDDRVVVLTGYRPPRGLDDPFDNLRSPGQVLLVDGAWEHVVALLVAALDPLGQPAVAVGPTHLAIGAERLEVRSLEHGEPVGTHPAPAAPWTAACFSDDGGHLASIGDDGTVAVWSEPDGAQLATWAAPGPSAACLAYHGREDLLATATRSGELTVWGGDGHPVASASVAREVQGLAFDLSGRLFVSTSPPNAAIEVFELPS